MKKKNKMNCYYKVNRDDVYYLCGIHHGRTHEKSRKVHRPFFPVIIGYFASSLTVSKGLFSNKISYPAGY